MPLCTFEQHRAQAEEAVRTAREALSELEVKCGELQTQVCMRDMMVEIKKLWPCAMSTG